MGGSVSVSAIAVASGIPTAHRYGEASQPRQAGMASTGHGCHTAAAPHRRATGRRTSSALDGRHVVALVHTCRPEVATLTGRQPLSLTRRYADGGASCCRSWLFHAQQSHRAPPALPSLRPFGLSPIGGRGAGRAGATTQLELDHLSMRMVAAMRVGDAERRALISHCNHHAYCLALGVGSCSLAGGRAAMPPMGAVVDDAVDHFSL